MSDQDPKRKAPRRKPLIKPRPRAQEETIPETSPSETVPLAVTAEDQPRFQFFLIDSGWDGPVARMVRQNLRMITHLQNHDPFYVLSRTQSSDILKRHPHLIGKDPILLARDLHGARIDGNNEYHGFHLNLGIIQNPERALEVLQAFLNFLAVHRKNADIDQQIRAKLHRDGLQGAVEVLRGGTEALI